jgi:hypothetical protein
MIYIVIGNQGERPRNLIGVYTDIDKAKERAETYGQSYTPYDDYDIYATLPDSEEIDHIENIKYKI